MDPLQDTTSLMIDTYKSQATSFKSIISNISDYFNYYDVQLEDLNKIDTKVHLLKLDVLYNLQVTVNTFETLLIILEKLPNTSKRFNCICGLTDVYHLIFRSELCLSGVLFQEPYFYSNRHLLNSRKYDRVRKYYKLETTQQFKRRCIKQLNKAVRQLKQANKKLTKLNKQINKIEMETNNNSRLVLNCNTWINGILENRYRNLLNSEVVPSVTVEEKERIQATIRKQI